MTEAIAVDKEGNQFDADLHMTKDGEPVLTKDGFLRRKTHASKVQAGANTSVDSVKASNVEASGERIIRFSYWQGDKSRGQERELVEGSYFLSELVDHAKEVKQRLQARGVFLQLSISPEDETMTCFSRHNQRLESTNIRAPIKELKRWIETHAYSVKLPTRINTKEGSIDSYLINEQMSSIGRLNDPNDIDAIDVEGKISI